MSEVYTVEIEKPKTHPQNARRSDVPAIMRSLERFGQVKPIVVQRSTGYVVAGNHVLEAARALGWSTIKCIVEDMDDETALAYLIADNRTSDKSSYDNSALADLLFSVSDLAGTAWGEEDRDLFMKQVSDDVPAWQNEQQQGDEVIERTDEQYDPMREILLMVPMSQMESFTRQIAELQECWKSRTTVETIRTAIDKVHAAVIREKPAPPPTLVKGVDF